MYSTHSFPDWESIDPQVREDDSEFVKRTARALKDWFGDYQSTHRPERDAPRFAKQRVMKVARVIDAQTKNQTIGEVFELLDWGPDLPDEATEQEIHEDWLSLVVYANQVRGVSWGQKEATTLNAPTVWQEYFGELSDAIRELETYSRD